MNEPSAAVKAARILRWGSGATPSERLFACGSSFSFFQAVRLLALLYAPEGKGSEARTLPVRFRSHMGLEFPGADIEEILPAKEGHPAEMVVNFLGLAGAHGPLPAVYTETLPRNRRSALRDFLDIFNHRLIQLIYRVRTLHRPELGGKSPSESLMANHLYALFGLGRDPESAMRNRMAIPDRALLYYSGLLAHHTRSSSGLASLLSDYYRIPVEIEEFCGAWLELADEQCTRLGTKLGCNHVLGESAILGKRIWEQSAGVVIRLGPLDLETYLSFLPQGERLRGLQDMIRFYLGDEIDFSLKLVLRSDHIPEARLQSSPEAASVHGGLRLGWMSWLKSSATPHAPAAQADRASANGEN
jgi:type VI secretion system protein ImpH